MRMARTYRPILTVVVALAAVLALPAVAMGGVSAEDVGGTVVSVVSGGGGVGTIVRIDLGSSDLLTNGQYGWVQDDATPFAYIRITELGADESSAEVTMNDSVLLVGAGNRVFFRIDRAALAREWYDKAARFIDADNYASALDCLNRAITLVPDEYSWYGMRGLCYFKTRDYARAIADMDIRIMHAPDDGWAYNIRGGAYEGLGDRVRAMADFKKSCDFAHSPGCENYRRLADAPRYITVPDRGVPGR
jgi:tetratricopeptide (TPR) repeat protein